MYSTLDSEEVKRNYHFALAVLIGLLACWLLSLF